MDNKEDDATVRVDNKSENRHGAFEAKATINIPKEVGIADVGATGTFLQPGGAPAVNVRPTKNPIKIS